MRNISGNPYIKKESNNIYLDSVLLSEIISKHETPLLIFLEKRIRENIKFMKKKNYDEIVDTSINQTLTRSINTSLTTLITITTLYILGVDSIKAFALPLIAGTITGTYSSIFIASPIWTVWKNWELKKGRYNAG